MSTEERTVSLRDGSTHGPDDGRLPSLTLVLRCDDPLAPSRRFPLAGLTSVLLGRGDRLDASVTRDARGAHLDVRIPDRHMSTSHGRLLRLVGDDWLIEDAGSKNGTVVNGAPCARAALGDGDLVELGASFLLFRVDAGPAGEPASAPLPGLETLSPVLAGRHAELARVAPSALPVLLLGETGVGKEVLARALHELSGRRGAFVAVNCGAIPAHLAESTLFGHRRGAFSGAVEHQPGVVRAADGGTLFLDEIGELPAPVQVALLRVLQEREVVPVGEARPVPVDLRVVAATHRDLQAALAAGSFREDLYARLAGVTIQAPPLRERREDLGLLIGRLLRRAPTPSAPVRFTPRAARALLLHDWPRNVRELDACLRSATLLAGGSEIDLRHLPEELRTRAPAPRSGDEVSGPELARLLEVHRGNVSAVARALATSRSQVHRLMKRHGLGARPSR